MPIYEYVCMECESHFEELVRGEEQVACPDCAATNVSRQFSTFAVHGVAKVATRRRRRRMLRRLLRLRPLAPWPGGTKTASC